MRAFIRSLAVAAIVFSASSAYARSDAWHSSDGKRCLNRPSRKHGLESEVQPSVFVTPRRFPLPGGAPGGIEAVA
jgi:hypothetical protein